MYNISTTLIPFRLEENGTIISEGVIPYDLLSHICYFFPNNKLSRKLIYQIDREEFSYQHIATEKDNESLYEIELRPTSEHWWYNWQEAVAYDLAQERLQASHTLRDQQNTEAQLRQDRIFQQIAESTFEKYQEMLIEQKQLTEAQVQINEAEQLRRDESRITLVRSIAMDPSIAPSALIGEFGQSGDVCRQIAAVMEKDISVSKQIIQLPADQWMASYDIMEVIGFQVNSDHEFAQEVFDKLPTNSSLRVVLKSFGWAK